ncbi:DNA translocase SftA [Anoxybacillus sp. P3H1B]|uniref:DNA translocase FtsK n=1 Tax=Anoxybacillus sp. P3H1B TaxID=1769293 RepID=UPI000798D72C|nr:DNA translocase FtsK [Anoxybacillus sp. P3H1B]KXG08857.1 DNA translocase SftA [Anoxybacillus sp. P3H1B]
MKWLKRLVRYLLQEEDRQPPIERKEQPIEKTAAELDVKVTYQYPTGKFRFPLIPDEASTRRKRSSKTYDEAEERQERREKPRREPESPAMEKRPFRPSEVPSPIYGYKGRPQPMQPEKRDSETELPEEKQDSLLSHHLDLPITYIMDLPDEKEHGSEKEEELIGHQPSLGESLALSDEEEAQPSAIEEVADSEEEQLLDVRPSEEQDGRPSEEEKEAKTEEQNAEASLSNEPQEKQAPTQRPSSRIPYNVMMLKQDREKWEARKKEKKQGEPAYRFPQLELLQPPLEQKENDKEWMDHQCAQLNETFANFNVGAKVVHVAQGPTVTRFEVQPAPGVKVNKITSLSDDIKLSLAAKDIRIEAPIPGKSTIGIEVPNAKSRPVLIREILQSEAFRASSSPLTVALGLDLSGMPMVTDLKKMPHGLIAGATGSGKSVCINAMLVSLLYKAAPHEVKLLLIDPKMVELAPYNDIPHLVSPVVTDVKAATGALKWAVEEMERRYSLFAHTGVRDIQKYNELVRREQTPEHHLPYIVIIIDELADLMMVAPTDVEEAVCRIAQKARACGIHLIVATQRPSVDVITGLIKANIPTRIAFSVSSQVDSRTIIDTNGAEKLLGRGDMLFLENGTSKTVRIQGNFVSDEEIERVVSHVKQQMSPAYLFEQDDFLKQASLSNEEDELFYEACEFVVQQGGASTSSLQRRFRIGYNRAARLMEMMEEQGIISEARGSKPRDVLITEEELAHLQEGHMI